jgi:hypothetical protein
MAAPKKLSVPRATRVDEDIARQLMRVQEDTGLVSAQVDREMLTRLAEIIRESWQPGQALKYFLRGLKYGPA